MPLMALGAGRSGELEKQKGFDFVVMANHNFFLN